MAMEQEKYAQVVNLRRKYLKLTAANKNKNETGIIYSAEAHLYCSAQPSVFSHILLNDVLNPFFFLSNKN